MKRIIAALLMMMLLCGCAKTATDYTLDTQIPTEPTETIQTAPSTFFDGVWQEYSTYPVERPSDNVIGNQYYYTERKTVSYYDFELEKSIVLCSQPNCTHSDESCYAFIADAASVVYEVWGDKVYAVASDGSDGGESKFLSLNPITGERRTLMDLTPEKGRYRNNFEMTLDGNTGFVQFWEYSIGEDDYYTDQINYAYAIDLESGETELLLCEPIETYAGYQTSGTKLVLQATTEQFLLVAREGEWKEEPMDYDKFIAQGHADEEYYDYLDTVIPEQSHYSVNRVTGEETRIFGNSYPEAHIQDSTGPYRNKMVSFVDGDRLNIYDGHTGQVTEYFQQSNLGFQSCKDGRIIFNVYPEQVAEDTDWKYFWYDLTTGEMQQFQQGESTMVFSITCETADYFIGLYNGAQRYISKADFYNQNYEAAKSF